MLATDTSSPAPAPQGGFANPVDGHFIRFPPFPKAIEGTTIMSFKEFKEGGIRVDPGPNEEEVDIYGIPTIPLRIAHSTNVCKTNTKRKRQAEEAKARKKAGAPSQRIWWEQWEDTEAIRFSIGFNPNSSRFERIHAAAGDFSTGRTWPVNFPSESGPKFIWDRFQRYIGIPEGSTVPQDKGKKGEQVDEDDAMSDDDVDDDEEGLNEPTSGNPLAGVVTDRDLPALIAKKKAIASNEENLSLFFNSPETSFKVFLTSYAQEKGYIWSDANLECMPRVLLFFANFLLRSKVLPEIDRNLRRSVEIITLALTELPNTSNIAKAFPDKFSLACTACWGKKVDGYSALDLGEIAESPTNIPKPNEVPQKEHPGIAGPVETTQSAISSWGTADIATEGHSWQTSAGEGAAWGSDAADNGEFNEGDSAVAKAVEDWLKKVDEHDTLLEFLGPTALPLTHQPGIVERSMRRIKSVIPPNPNPPKSSPQGEGIVEPDADAVEVDLDRQFMKVVLSPLPVDWDGGESPVYSRPTILGTSRGPVVGAGAPEVPEGTNPKPHDPLNDDITLLIENKETTVGLLLEGMSVGGTWVQLARQGEVVKKKKKGKSKKVIPSYWYLDELALTAPSFWTVPAK